MVKNCIKETVIAIWEEKAIEQCGIDIAINDCIEYNIAKMQRHMEEEVLA